MYALLSYNHLETVFQIYAVSITIRVVVSFSVLITGFFLFFCISKLLEVVLIFKKFRSSAFMHYLSRGFNIDILSV